MSKRTECPFCEGSGLTDDGEMPCDACDGTGKWGDAAYTVIEEAREILTAQDNPYRQSAAVMDLLALVPPKRAKSA